MNESLIGSLIVLSLAFFLIPKKYQAYYNLVLCLVTAAVSIQWVLPAILEGKTISYTFLGINLTVYPLSAFFVILVQLIFSIGSTYAIGYLQPYYAPRSQAEISLHFWAMYGLQFSMTAL